MKQKGTRYGFLILFLFLAFTLLCSLSAMAQINPLSTDNLQMYGLTAYGNVTSGSNLFTLTSGGLNHAAVGAAISGTGIPASTTVTAVSDCNATGAACTGGTMSANATATNASLLTITTNNKTSNSLSVSCVLYAADGVTCVKGEYYRSDGVWFNGNWVNQFTTRVLYGNTTSGSPTLTLTTGTFSSADVGLTISLTGYLNGQASGAAGPTGFPASGAGCSFAILAVTSSTTANLACTATSSITNELFTISDVPGAVHTAEVTLTSASTMLTVVSGSLSYQDVGASITANGVWSNGTYSATTGLSSAKIVSVGGCSTGQTLCTSAIMSVAATATVTSPSEIVAISRTGHGNWLESAGNGGANVCAGCHHGSPKPSSAPPADANAGNSSGMGPNYLIVGHKNMLRKVSPGSDYADWTGVAMFSAGSASGNGTPGEDSSGNVINWGSYPSSVAPTITLASNGTTVPLYYFYGWIDNPDELYQGSTGYQCARCHTTGYRFDGLGPEPTLYDAATPLTDAQLSRAPADGACSVSPATYKTQAACVGAGGVWSTASWYMTGIQCERCHKEDMQLNASGTTPTQFPTGQTLPANYLIAYTTAGGRVGHEGPSGQSFPSATNVDGSNAFVPVGSYATSLCIECHRQEIDTAPTTTLAGTVVTNPVGNTGAVNYNLGTIHPAQLPGQALTLSGANQPSNLGAFSATFKCSIASITTSDPAYYNDCISAGGTVSYAPSESHGANGAQAFLNSPHARYSGTIDQTVQNSPDLSVTLTANTVTGSVGGYNSDFVNWGEAPGSTTAGTTGPAYSATDNGGCAGCHDVHNSTLSTTVSPGQVYGSTNADGSPYVPFVNPTPGVAAGAVLNATNVAPAFQKQCTDCHTGAGLEGAPIVGSSPTSVTVNHSGGSGTPLANAATNPDSQCIICHMVGASGAANYHYFRINPSATYYTLPNASQYYLGTGSGVKAQPNTYTETVTNGNVRLAGTYAAVALDVDMACGQCHGGGGPTDSRGDTNPPYTNPYGLVSPGAPYFQRTYLAGIAANIHQSSTTTTLTAPTFTPASGTYATSQSVQLSDATGSATICYTTDNTNPTATVAGACDSPTGSNEKTYSVAFTLAPNPPYYQPQTVKAIATQAGDLNSSLVYATYTINPSATTVAAPSFSLMAGTYTLKTSSSTLSNVLADATSGATICYTTNGSTPTAAVPGTCDAGEGSVASGYSLTIASTETVMAIGTLAGDVNSGVVSATYALIPAAPTFSPGTETVYQSGNGSSWPTVTLVSNTNATIYYCEVAAGGSACTPSTQYTAPIWPVSCISGAPPCGVIIYANATFGGTASSVSHATYNIKPGDPTGTPHAATPTFSPLPGVITATEPVTITTTSSNAVICYTLNGAVPEVSLTATPSAPACTVGTVYTVPVALNAVEGNIYTIRAVAGGVGYLQSEPIAKGEYIFR